MNAGKVVFIIIAIIVLALGYKHKDFPLTVIGLLIMCFAGMSN